MIRLLVLILVALLLAGGAVHLLGAEAGYVLLSYGEYTIEMTLWTLVGLTILALILLWALVQLLMMVFGVPGSWGSWRKTRRRKASAKLSDQGQLASVEGDWQGAKQALEQSFAKDDGSQPLINYVLAARANHALGDAQAAGEALVDGAKHAPKGSAALGIVEAEMLADRGQLSIQCVEIDARAFSGIDLAQALYTLPDLCFVLRILRNKFIDVGLLTSHIRVDELC